MNTSTILSQNLSQNVSKALSQKADKTLSSDGRNAHHDDANAQKAEGIHSPYEMSNWWPFSMFCLVALFSTYYLQTEVLTDNVYYNSLTGHLSTDKITDLINMKNRVGLFGYLLAPVTLLIRVLFTSLCIGTGLLVTSRKLPWKYLFKIALFAEAAFAAAALLKLFLLAFFHSVDNIGDLQSFAPLSLYSLFKSDAVPGCLIYPLQTLNLFELLYWLLLAAGLGFFLRKSFVKMLAAVLGSYGIGLLCWMACIAFMNIVNATT
jgi:hypothetical protein